MIKGGRQTKLYFSLLFFFYSSLIFAWNKRYFHLFTWLHITCDDGYGVHIVSLVKRHPVEFLTTGSAMKQCFYKWVPVCLQQHEAQSCRWFVRKEMHSTCLSGLEDTHNGFWWENTECKHNFVHKKIPQGAFNWPKRLETTSATAQKATRLLWSKMHWETTRHVKCQITIPRLFCYRSARFSATFSKLSHTRWFWNFKKN